MINGILLANGLGDIFLRRHSDTTNNNQPNEQKHSRLENVTVTNGINKTATKKCNVTINSRFDGATSPLDFSRCTRPRIERIDSSRNVRSMLVPSVVCARLCALWPPSALISCNCLFWHGPFSPFTFRSQQLHWTEWVRKISLFLHSVDNAPILFPTVMPMELITEWETWAKAPSEKIEKKKKMWGKTNRERKTSGKFE